MGQKTVNISSEALSELLAAAEVASDLLNLNRPVQQERLDRAIEAVKFEVDGRGPSACPICRKHEEEDRGVGMRSR